jgi:hypothetical protein
MVPFIKNVFIRIYCIGIDVMGLQFMQSTPARLAARIVSIAIAILPLWFAGSAMMRHTFLVYFKSTYLHFLNFFF